MTCRLETDKTTKKLEKPQNNVILIDANQIQQQQRSQQQQNQDQQQRENPLIKPAMNTIEACTILDNTIDSLRRSLNLYAARNNRPVVYLPASSHPMELPETSQNSPQPTENSNIVIETYKDETQMPDIMRVITKELSEPYSIYTYRFFIHNWPELCLLARDTTNNSNIGVIVCKLDHDVKWRRGYIAMLAVEESYRRRGIGKLLVQRSIEVMREKGCDEVMLEAEVSNKSALILYDRLGFIRERRLYRYYLNGSDAFRLKLLFADCWPETFHPIDSDEYHGHAEEQQQPSSQRTTTVA